MMLVQPCSGNFASFRLSKDSEKLAGRILAETQVEVLQCKGKWSQVRWGEEKTEGWVKTANLRSAVATQACSTRSSQCLAGQGLACDFSDERPSQRPRLAVGEAQSTNCSSQSPINDSGKHDTGALMMLVHPCSGNFAAFRLSKDSKTVAGRVLAGTQVEVLQCTGKWSQVRWGEEKTEGWLKTANLRSALVTETRNSQCLEGQRLACDASDERPAQRPRLAEAQNSSENTISDSSTHDTAAEAVPTWLGNLSTYTERDAVDSAMVSSNLSALWSRLFKYQQIGVRFALSRGGRAMIADEMGLGKSAQALAIAAQYKDEWPVLIVSPTSLCAQWHANSSEWLSLPGESIQVLRNGKSRVLPGKSVVICSYDLLRASEYARQTDDEQPFRVVICDESHRLKDRESKRFQTLLPVARDAFRVILLSGTPMPNSAAEIWAQLALLLPQEKLPDFEDFANRYANRSESKRLGIRWRGFRCMAELNDKVLQHVMIQRKKVEVAHQLPAVRRRRVMLTPMEESLGLGAGTDCKKRSDEDIVSAWATAANGAVTQPAENILKELIVQVLVGRDLQETTLGQLRIELEHLLRLEEGTLDEYRETIGNLATEEVSRLVEIRVASQECCPDVLASSDRTTMNQRSQCQKEESAQACKLKLRATLTYVQDLLVCLQGKVLFFAHHHAMLEALEIAARIKGLNPVRIDGRVARDTRQKLVESFQKDTEVRVAVCSIMACSEGLSLIAASTMVFCELHWTPAVLEQCEARVHRHGQTNSVDILYLVAQGTIDEWMWRVLQQKRGANCDFDEFGFTKKSCEGVESQEADHLLDENPH